MVVWSVSSGFPAICPHYSTHLFPSPRHSHFLFHASFVPLIALHSDSSSPQRPSWHEDVDLARNTLSELREDPLAERCLMIINRLAPSSSPAPGSSALAGDLEVLNGMLQSNPAWLGAGSESAESW